jgi:trimeric autotransporter adhesin
VGGSSFPTVLALDVSADGDTLHVGGLFSIKGVARRNTGAVSTVIATLRAWRPTATTATVSSLTVSGSGRTVFVGGRGAGGFVHAYGPASGGAPVWTAAANGDVEALAVSSTTVYVGGHFTTIGGAGRGHMAALRAAGGAVEAWNPGANGALGVFGAAAAPGHVAIGGEFTQVAGASHQGFAQFSGVP